MYKRQPYEAGKARLVLREMADSLSMDLVSKGFVTDQLVVTIGYDIENLTDPERRRKYRGAVVKLSLIHIFFSLSCPFRWLGAADGQD